MYRLARKRRLLYSVVKKSPVCRATLSGSEVTSSLQLVTSYPQCVTSSFQHVRGLHSTHPSLNLMERMAGVGSFRYDVILPDNDSKPEVNCYLLYLITCIISRNVFKETENVLFSKKYIKFSSDCTYFA